MPRLPGIQWKTHTDSGPSYCRAESVGVIILYLHEIQARSRTRNPACFAITALQYGPCPGGFLFTLADRHEYASYVSHHVVQETIGDNVDVYKLTQPVHCQTVYRPDRTFRLAGAGPVSRKVMRFPSETMLRPAS